MYTPGREGGEGGRWSQWCLRAEAPLAGRTTTTTFVQSCPLPRSTMHLSVDLVQPCQIKKLHLEVFAYRASLVAIVWCVGLGRGLTLAFFLLVQRDRSGYGAAWCTVRPVESASTKLLLRSIMASWAQSHEPGALASRRPAAQLGCSGLLLPPSSPLSHHPTTPPSQAARRELRSSAGNTTCPVVATSCS